VKRGEIPPGLKGPTAQIKKQRKMKTASQILEAKGYENDEINDIVNNLDIKVREEFKAESLPVHLWEAYYKGDASEDDLNEVAKMNECEDYDQLLKKMDESLSDLAEKYPVKSN
jgi:hypothetical protein